MENLVGRKLIALQNSFLGLTKGKEYEIIKQTNDKLWIVTDKGTEEFTFLINSDLLKLVDEQQFKQGDKVLVSYNEIDWHETEFVCYYKDYYYTINGRAKHIKPYEEEIKVGDWVMVNDEKAIIKINEQGIKYLDNYTKITDEVLINKLNEL